MTVSTGSLVTTSSFNSIQSLISGVLGPNISGYGFLGSNPSISASSGTVVTAESWINLYNDIARCRIHQTDAMASIPSGISLPSTGTQISSQFLNYLETQANLASVNAATVSANQLGVESTVSQRVASWSLPITQHTEYSWSNSTVARYFFNLGGKFAVDLGYVGADATWGPLIDTARASLATVDYDLADYLVGNKTLYSSSSGGNSIDVNVYKVSGSTIKVISTLTPASSVSLDIIGTMTNYYSLGNVGPAPYGVAAPRPNFYQVEGYDGAAEAPPATKILNVVSFATFTGIAGEVTGAQTITIQNIGTAAVNITGISFTDNYNLTPVVSGLPGVISLAPGANTSFSLAYQSVSVGTNSVNYITILCNSDVGNVTVPTYTTISAPTFNFSLSPSSWMNTVTSLVSVGQFFSIVPIYGSFSTYSAGLSGAGASAFDLITTNASGPQVNFKTLDNINGEYNATLSVTVNSITKTANISVTRAVSNETIHLGDWISPYAAHNSVIGMSYDVIAGTRYLTIGVGIGADYTDLNEDNYPNYAVDLTGNLPEDFSNTVYIGDAAANSYASTSTLGLSADNNFVAGQALYPIWYNPYEYFASQPDPAHVQFLRDFGSWVKPLSNTPRDYVVTTKHKFTLPSATTINWEFTVDDYGYFAIDDVIVGDLRYTSAPYSSVYSGTWELAAGEHTISYAGWGIPRVNGFAIRLSYPGGTEIWSTRTPVRTSNQLPYRYWAEVYRIPLDKGTSATYYSADYCVKYNASVLTVTANTGRIAIKYGDVFGLNDSARSMFTVVDDNGNLTISMNQKVSSTGNSYFDTTLNNLPYSVYYYSTIGTRYKNLEGPIGDGSQTRQFIGFTRDGEVRTSITTYPGYVVPGGGGGGVNPIPYFDERIYRDQLELL